MSKLFKILIFSFIFISVCAAQKRDYYYYQGKPFYITKIPDAIFIELNEKADQSALNNLLLEFPALYIKKQFSFEDKRDFLYINESLNKDNLQDLISRLNQKKDIVSNASPVFKVPEGFGNPAVRIGVLRQIIAQFKTVTSDYQVRSYLNTKGMSIVKEYSLSGGKTYLIDIPQGEYAIDYANELYESGIVNYSEPNLFFTNLLQGSVGPVDSRVTPNDPLYSQQWSHKNTGSNIPGGITGTAGCDMRTDSAWNYTMGSPNVIVSVVDSGIDTLHEDLSSRIIHGLSINTYSNLPYAWDDMNHGTACSGIIAATGNNNIGVIGVAPLSRIFGVKIFNSAGNTTDDAIINGLIAAWQRGSWVSSNSWGGGTPISAGDNALSDGVTYGRNGKGIIWSFATGNDNSVVSWPATNANVISVGGISPCNQRKNPSSCDGEDWWGANYGTGLEIVSPCVKIYTTDRSGSVGYSSGNYTEDFNGTSSATPNVSGVCALILAVDSSLTWQALRERICSTADKVGSYTYNQAGQLGLGGWNNEMGYGKINAYKVVKLTAELMGPSITHTPLLNTEQITGSYIVNCVIAPNGSPLNLSELKLLWSKNNTSITDSVILTSTGGNNFTGNIISTGAGLYRYYIKAKDNLNRTTTSPVGAPGSLYSFTATADVIAPVITHTPLQNTIQNRWPVDISANVTDNIGLQSVQCEFRVNGGFINTFTMPFLSGTEYKGTFTGFVNIGDVIEYRIKATDNSSQHNIAYYPASGFNSFNIINSLGMVLVIDDDVTLQGRVSNDKGGTGNLISPLGASSTLFTSALTEAGYLVDQVTFSLLNTTVLSDYDVVILSAGVKESTMFSDAAKRTALVNYTLTGGKTLVEGGEVGYIYRRASSTSDLDPLFRRNLLLDSVFVNDRDGANLQSSPSSHPIFNLPNIITSPMVVSNGGSLGYGARDEMTVQPITGISRIANWVGGTASNGGIFIYNPGGDTSICRNISFSFAVSQFGDQTVAKKLIVNSVRYLIREYLPVNKTLNITAAVQGLWNGSAMVSDTVTVELRGTLSPYSIVETKRILLNSAGTGIGVFTLASNSTPYYIVIKHRNSIETWSSSGQQFISNLLTYNFTSSQSQAYGNNLVLKDGRFCIYNGDVDQNGIIDIGDLSQVFINSVLGIGGYVVTDLNGSSTTDAADLTLVFNNNVLGIEVKRPADYPTDLLVKRN